MTNSLEIELPKDLKHIKGRDIEKWIEQDINPIEQLCNSILELNLSDNEQDYWIKYVNSFDYYI